MSITDLSQLKKQNSADSIAALTDKLEKLDNRNTRQVDERFWKPTLDKSGNGSALIRFLPPPPGEDIPFVKMYSHYFQGPTGLWYVENSLTTLGKNDPVSEYNTERWNAGDKATARKQKRKLNYFTNILVINDPKAPENNGKVFLYKFGSKIMDKLNDLMYPPEEADELTGEVRDPVFPFNFWEGCDFKLVVRKVAGFPNYDTSEFLAQSPIAEDDAEIEKIWNSQHALKPLVAEDQFKSYEELKAKFEKVLGLDGTATVSKTSKTTAPASTHETSSNVTEDDSDSFDDTDELDVGDFEDDLDDLEELASLIDD